MKSPSTNWQLFPKSNLIPKHLKTIADLFDANSYKISSEKFELSSNEVLAVLADPLEGIGFKVERSKNKDDKIRVPVLFGRNGAFEKSFDADAVNEDTLTVIEIEAGRAVANNQFLKDLFQACMMTQVENLVIAVRNRYKGNADFEIVVRFFDTLFVSGRLNLPLKNILIIGY